ncbi:pectate lyase family protein [Aridibaculum aurantiacum]|uniref:pectate lyase family protein n=1 Tax=Aridibaculum aurantiacum TaxID=2810307 RepID=UPI001A96F865|nr:pectate lyase [Aridibaculum aurantiacum]
MFKPLRNKVFLALSLLFSASIYIPVQAQQIAFPGAEGFGKYASGGRGGKVVEVTNLNDDGEGSFRHALQQHPDDPITVVFRTSGLIDLKTPLVIRRSNVTIAGQTAPGDGICLKGNSFIISGAGKGGNKGNIIVRYIRSRPGGTDKKGLYGFDMENCHNVIIDHCSFSWANEEVAAMYDTKNTTVQWSIVSEGLYEAGHQKGHRSYGGVWGGQYASYHHNLLTNLNSRAVRFNGSRAHDTVALIDYRNNIIYNWGSANAPYGGDMKIKGGVSQVNMVNNYYIPGPATAITLKFMQALHAGDASTGTGEWYLSGNIMEGDKALTKDNYKGLDLSKIPEQDRSKAIAKSPFAVTAAIADQSAKDAYKAVLANAGATFPKRDAVDERVVNETKTKTAKGMGVFGKPGIIDSPEAVGGWPVYKTAAAPVDTDHDGMPDEWEKKNKLDPNNPEDRNNVGPDGYTMLEKYLNSLVTK